MNPITPISCELHDHVEVACLFGYRLEIETRDGRKSFGRAEDTQTVSSTTEHLVIATDAGPLQIPMHEITKLKVLTPKARFQELKFNNRGAQR